MDKAAPACYTFTIRLRYPNQPGRFERLLAAIERAHGDLVAADVVHVRADQMTRDLTIHAHSEEHTEHIVAALTKVRDVQLTHVSDRVFLMHLGGKLAVHSKVPLTTRDALTMAYTPGVGRIAAAIADDKEALHSLTIKHNAVAVVGNGSSVLDLGALGPQAALPVLEGKAMLFKEFGGIDAYPIAVDAAEPEEFVRTVRNIADGFGGINLDCISAPQCFAIEEQLRKKLDIPVLHDTQHATAIVVLAALTNALRVVRKPLAEVRILVVGAGSVGRAVVQLLLEAGARDIICCDSHGTIHKGRLPDFDASKTWLARRTNWQGIIGGIEKAAVGRDVFIGASRPGVFASRALRVMAPEAIVFALANPRPEIDPEAAARRARVVATSRSDHPNQISNILAFPGIFRGALDVRASDINEPMKLAAARAIASCVGRKELCEEYIIPSVFNREVVHRVAHAVADAAVASGVARRKRN
jgi:malate dehydrogenase (oxaloacetate-decarboxylating)